MREEGEGRVVRACACVPCVRVPAALSPPSHTPHDADTQHDTDSFVTEPHGKDGSFQRVGRWLKAAKARRGLE